MGLACVVSTFVMCILFNIILPTGDVQSDLRLMYQALTFDLGDSLELEGCKSCYYKTEKEVFYPKRDLNNNSCKTCLYDENSICGIYPPIVKKMRELKYERNCAKNETLIMRITNHDELKDDECDESFDRCCMKQSKETKGENPIQKLDPKKVFWCEENIRGLGECLVVGKASGMYCKILEQTEPLSTQKSELIFKILQKFYTLFANETILFYPYNRINQTWLLEEKNHSITDPEIECGLLFFRQNENEPPAYGLDYKYKRHCNEDSCLTHLKGLRYATSISNLSEWRSMTDYSLGIKIGGKACRLLQIYGTSILIPILLNFSFNVVLFVNDFREKKANIFEIVPLVLLFYPQYKTIKFLAQYLIHRNEDILYEEKKENDRVVAPLEPFLESCLQVRTLKDSP